MDSILFVLLFLAVITIVYNQYSLRYTYDHLFNQILHVSLQISNLKLDVGHVIENTQGNNTDQLRNVTHDLRNIAAKLLLTQSLVQDLGPK